MSINRKIAYTNDSDYLGVGTNSPSAPLDVVGSSFMTGSLKISISNNTIAAANAAIRIDNSSNQSMIYFTTNGTQKSSIRGDSSGNLIFNNTSNNYYFNNDFGNNATIQLINTATTFLAAKSTGEVGIGTTTPTEKLHLSGGTLRIDGATNGIRIFKDGNDSAVVSHLYLANAANTRAYGWQLNADGSSLNFWTYDGNSWQNKITHTAAGNVGIGKDTPNAKLDVSGNAVVSGSITSTGNVESNSTQASSWGHPLLSLNSGWTAGSYPTLGSTGGSAGSLIMLHNPHIPFRTDNAAGPDSGKAAVRMAIDAAGTNWWDMGLYGDAFHIFRGASGLRVFQINSSGNIAIGKSGTSDGINARLDVNGNAIITGSLAVTQAITASNLVVTNLTVQTITASNEIITGSSQFGTLSTNKHQFTGSVDITGSFTVASGLVGIGTYTPSAIYKMTIDGVGSSGAPLGGIVFRQAGYDVLYIGNIATTNNTDVEFWNPRNGFVRFATNNSERLRIDSSGNVGIGTTSPSEKLHVVGNVRITDGTAGNLYLVGARTWRWIAGNTGYGVGTGFGLYDETAGAYRLTVDLNGNLGVGTTNPSEKLEVNGNILSYGSAGSVGSGTALYIGPSNNSRDISFTRVGTAALGIGRYNGGWYESVRIDSSGNVGIGTTSPSYKLDVNGSLNATSYYDNGTASYVSHMYTFNLGAQSTSSFFPIRFTGTPNTAGGIHTFEIVMDSFGGADPFNHHSVLGQARGSGWTDLPAFFDIFHNCYDDNERSYLGLYRGTQSCTDLVLYVRGGKTYYVKTPSQASVSTTAITISDSVFAIKNSSGTDVSGTSANISFMVNLITSNQGKLVSHNTCISGNLGVGIQNPGYKLEVSGDIYSNSGAIRVAGTNSFYFQTYGGGWYMQDTSWIRSVGDKSVWVGAGYLGGNGGLTVGYGGTAPSAGGAIIAGNLGLGTSSAGERLHVVGNQILGDTSYANYGYYLRIPFASSNLAAGTQRGYVQFDSGPNTSVNIGDAYNWKIGAVARAGNSGNYNSQFEILRSTRNGVSDNTDFAISRDGYVGIGTTTPVKKFTIYNGTAVIHGETTGSSVINESTYGLVIAPLIQRSSTVGSYYPGIAFNHLYQYSGQGTTTYNANTHGWIGLRLTDTTGTERSSLVFATKTGTGLPGSDLPTERMCITHDGLVGIGTTTPATPLNILVGSGTADGTVAIRVGGPANYQSLELGTTNTYDGFIRSYGNDLKYYAGHMRTIGATSSESHRHYWYTSKNGSTDWSTVKMVLNEDGYLGVGQSSPTYRLEVAGSAGSGGVARIGSTDYTTTTVLSVAPGVVDFDAPGSSGGRFKINSIGNVGISTGSPVSKLHVVSGSGAASIGSLPAGTTATFDSSGNNYLLFRNTADNASYSGLMFQDNNVGGYIVFRNYVGSGANDGTNGDALYYGTYTDHIFQAGSTETANSRTEVFRIKQSGKTVFYSGVWHNSSDGYERFHFGASDTTYFKAPNSTFVFRNSSDVAMMTLNTTGLGIGTTGPGEMIELYKANNSGNIGIRFHEPGVVEYKMGICDADDKFYITNNNGATGIGSNTTGIILQSNGNVGIGTASPGYKLEVNGSFAATTKSFVIKHPTKEGMKLQHGVTEGPEHSVYVRGKTKNNKIVLPEYWTKLVHEDTITVQLTSIGKHQDLVVLDVNINEITIENQNTFNKSINCYYYVQAERKDIEKMKVEY